MSFIDTDNLKTISNYAKQIGRVNERVRQLIKEGKIKTIFIDGKEFVITKTDSDGPY